MLLAIDAGNTNVVFAVFDGDRIAGKWRISTNPARTTDEYVAFFSQLLAAKGIEKKSVTHSIIASVVPKTVFALKSLCADFFGSPPSVVGEDIDPGIKVKLDNPGEVGADRLVNAVSARKLAGSAVIVVDFGTATTFDMVEEDGSYAGGVIAPGINLSLEALQMAAAKLPRISVEKPARVIGKNTVEAMRSGIYWGYAGLIEGIITGIRSEAGREAPVLATGGLAPLFAESIPAIGKIEPDLTLIGLNEIYKMNKKMEK